MPKRIRPAGLLELPSRTRPWLGLAIAVLGPIAITPFVRMAPMSRFPSVLYMLLVVVATVVGRWIAATVAILLSVLLLDYYFVTPVGRLGFDGSEGLWTILSFVLAALVVSQLLLGRDRAVASAEADRERLAFLTRVGDTLGASLDYDATLQGLSAVLVPGIADWFSLDVLEDGTIRNAVVWHRDPRKLELAQKLQEQLRPAADAATGPGNVIRTGVSELTQTIDEEMLTTVISDPETLSLVRSLGLRCAMVVPLTARGRTFGAMTLIGAETHGRYTASDLRLAETVADRAALAIDNALLYRAEAEAREEATNEARRNTLLKEVTEAFGRATTTDEVAAAMLQEGLEAAGARLGVIGLLSHEDTHVDIVATRGYQPGGASYWKGFPLDEPYPLSRAIRERRPIMLASVEERDREYPELSGEGPQENHVLVCAPLMFGGKVVGGFSASFPPGVAVDTDDLAFLGLIGEQCAQAFERTGAYERETRTRRHFDELATISRRLALTLDLEATVATVVRLLLEHLGNRAALYLVQNGSVALAADGRVEGSGVVVGAPPVQGSTTKTDEIPKEVLLAIDRAEAVPLDAGHLDGAAGMVLPLTIAGRTFGAIMVAEQPSGRDYTERDELAFCREVARRTARAIENARLYRERDYIARTLQQSLLPPTLPEVPSIDVEALFLPAFPGIEIGGDFYDLFETTSGRWAAVIGDVCGKGVDAAVLTGLARHTLRAAAGAARPSDALRALNAAMLREELDGKFCTVCLALIDPSPTDGLRLTIACGGHPLPQLLSSGNTHAVGRYGTLLGVAEEPRLVDVEVRLDASDALVMYTDGLLRKDEAFTDEPPRLVKALSGTARSAAEIKGRVERYVDELISEEQDDDIAVLVLQAR